jgi:hypothetical protein
MRLPTYRDFARARGLEDGKAAGSWVIDGNTSDEAKRTILQQLDDGDPVVYDLMPSSPLSGEWADGLLPRDILEPFGIDEDDDRADDILTAYEDAYDEAVVDEVERSCIATLERTP